MSRLERMLRQMEEEEGVALHIHVGHPVRVRVKGRLTRMDVPPLTSEELDSELRAITDDAQWEKITAELSSEFLCDVGGRRYRAHCFVHQGGRAIVLRTTAHLTRFAELDLPSTVQRLAHLRRGLVIIAGPTCSGKSTTVGALMNELEGGRPKHVVTIESPIEVTYDHQRTTISQREVGTHTPSFAEGLRAALHQGADVTFTSDVPDATCCELLLEAAASGTLVIATVRASGVVRALEELADRAERRHAMLNGLAEHLSAVISLLRLPRASGLGHCVATELAVRSRALVHALREDDLPSIREVMEASDSMLTMDDALADLLERGVLAFEDAYDHARDKDRFHDLRVAPRRAMRHTRHDRD